MAIVDLLVGVVSHRHSHTWVKAIYDIPNHPSNYEGLCHFCHFVLRTWLVEREVLWSAGSAVVLMALVGR